MQCYLCQSVLRNINIVCARFSLISSLGFNHIHGDALGLWYTLINNTILLALWFMDVPFVYFSSGLNGWEAACNSVHVISLWAHWAANDIVKHVLIILSRCAQSKHYIFQCSSDFPAVSTLDVMYSIIGAYNIWKQSKMWCKKKSMQIISCHRFLASNKMNHLSHEWR